MRAFPLGRFHLPAMPKAQQKWVLRPELQKIRGSGKGQLLLCARGSLCSTRGAQGAVAPPELVCLDLWLCHLLGWELKCPPPPPPRLHPCPPVLPVCSSCCTAPAGPFFLFFFPFFLWLSCRNASAAFWSRATNNSISSRVQFRICCEDRNPKDRGESKPGLRTAGSPNPRACCISWENAQEWAIQA